MTWVCQRCGACCKILNTHRPVKMVDRLILKLFNRGDGICRFLRDDNLCSIYEARPNICRVDKEDKELEKACQRIREFVKDRECK